MTRRTNATVVVRTRLVLVALVLVGACGPSTVASPTPSGGAPEAGATPSGRPVAVVSPSPSAQAWSSPSPAGPSASPPSSATASPSITPSPSPTATPGLATPALALPSSADLWARAADGLRTAGRLRIRVIGPVPGELRYESDASATVIDGAVVFVCRDARVFDGQSGWAELPGSWRCGAEALVHGFRLAGQPIDAWSESLPADEAIRESVTAGSGGTWRWSYEARNPFAGGAVRTTVIVDAATGQIRSAERVDPLGQTTYGISYREAFPPIAVP